MTAADFAMLLIALPRKEQVELRRKLRAHCLEISSEVEAKLDAMREFTQRALAGLAAHEESI